MKRPMLFVFAFVILLSIVQVKTPNRSVLEQKVKNNTKVTASGDISRISYRENCVAVWVKDVTVYDECSHITYSHCGNLLLYYSGQQNLYIKNQISVSGKLQYFSVGTNPGQFNAYMYYKGLGLDFSMFSDSLIITDDKQSIFANKIQELKQYMHEGYERYLGEDAGIMEAMLLGEKQQLAEDTKILYQKNGIAHILAISALHISFIGLTLYRGLKKIYIPNEIAIPISIFMIYLYGYLTDFSVSTNRAIIMLVLSLVSILLGRTYDFVSGISLSGSLILLQNPYQLWNCGFLLSFGAVIGIAVLYPTLLQLFEKEDIPVFRVIKSEFQLFRIIGEHTEEKETIAGYPWLKNYSRIFLQSILLSGSIQCMTLPILLFFYYEIPIYSVLLNFFVLPLLSFLVAAGVFLGLLNGFAGIGCWMLTYFIRGVLQWYHWICQMFLRFPCGIQIVGKPSWLRIFVYYGLLFLCIVIIRLGKKSGMCLLLIAILILCTKGERHKLQITLLDVGQGDGILIESPSGKNYFIDGGSTTVKSVETYRITPCLKSKGIGTIDYGIITHMDEDHISGMKELLVKNVSPGAVKIKNLIVPKLMVQDSAYQEVISLANQNDVKVYYFQMGDKISDGKIQFTCFNPYDRMVSEERNDSSIVLRMEYEKFSMLFTGDVSNSGEENLIKNDALPPCDILKLAHHGSKYTNSTTLLEKIQPKVSIISAGEGNERTTKMIQA